MDRCGRVIGVCAIGLCAAAVLGGCTGTRTGTPLMSRDTPFILATADDAQGVQARSQLPELPPPPPTVQAQASPAADVKQVSNIPAPPPGAPSGVTQAVARPDLRQSLTIVAWVNGTPIFQDEVYSSLPGQLIDREAAGVPPNQRDAVLGKYIAKVLDNIIDQELLSQDAVRKLEKNQKYLVKIKEAARRETDKRLAQNLEQNKLGNLDDLRQVLAMRGWSLEGVRRVLERDFLSTEYLKVRVAGYIQKVGHAELREYYEQHLNEFQRPDSVKWQNLFIAVGPKHATAADARAFAERVAAAWRGGEDLAKLLEYDDGSARATKGEGIGHRREDIRPAELAEYLFSLKDGEFGPLLELPTGVHIFRVVKRDYAGVQPFDEQTQLAIDRRLKNEIFDNERKIVVRELRERYRDTIFVVTGKE
jgi:hypothetical protein